MLIKVPPDMKRHVLRTIFLVAFFENISSKYLWFEVPGYNRIIMQCLFVIFLNRNSTSEAVEHDGHLREKLLRYIWFESAIQKLVKTQLDSNSKIVESIKKENIENTERPHSNPLKPEGQQFSDFILRHSW